jgi:hypothetical protein
MARLGNCCKAKKLYFFIVRHFNFYCLERIIKETGILSYIYFFIEVPRSRCYGRTAALRQIVQPCDEIEVFFCSSHFNGARMESN